MNIYNAPIYDMWMIKNGKLTLVTKRISLNSLLLVLEETDHELLEVANPMFAPIAMRKQLQALADAANPSKKKPTKCISRSEVVIH